MSVKRCRDCLKDLDTELFYPMLECKLGVRPECKECNLQAKGEYQKNNMDRHNSRNRKYYNSVRTNSYRLDPRKYLYKVAKSRAKQNGIEFTITLNDIVLPSHCPITGVEITTFITDRKQSYTSAASLDKIDNTKGYIPGNVRVISRRANMRKSDLTILEVERLLAYMKGEI